MCADPGVDVVLNARLITFPPVLVPTTPIQPPSMLACGYGWSMNTTTGLVEPACGKPAEMKYCPDSAFEVKMGMDGNYEPSCSVGPQPEGTECDTEVATSCDDGLLCMCSSSMSRSLLFASTTGPSEPAQPEWRCAADPGRQRSLKASPASAKAAIAKAASAKAGVERLTSKGAFVI